MKISIILLNPHIDYEVSANIGIRIATAVDVP